MQKILVVDDAAFMRKRTRELLQANGYAVIEASNGADAVSKYEKEKPGLVLMDITMPVLDGIGALRAIKALDRDAKVVIVTALGQRSMVLEAIRAGAKDFVVKPYKPEKLLMAVAKQCPLG